MARDRVKMVSILGSEVEINDSAVEAMLAAGFRTSDTEKPAARKAAAKRTTKKENE